MNTQKKHPSGAFSVSPRQTTSSQLLAALRAMFPVLFQCQSAGRTFRLGGGAAIRTNVEAGIDLAVTGWAYVRPHGVLVADDQVNDEPDEIRDEDGDGDPKPRVHAPLLGVEVDKAADENAEEEAEDEYAQRQKHKHQVKPNCCLVVHDHAKQNEQDARGNEYTENRGQRQKYLFAVFHA